MMHYEGRVFRPPAEHASILLQVTVGCSHNKCIFCGMYKGERFKIKDNKIINKDIDLASKYYRNKKRLFLCDGDALIIPFEKLLKILKQINLKMPWITRIGLYANAKSLKRKSLDELKELKKHKLGICYMGLESGDDDILKEVNKGVDVKTQIEQGKKVKEAGMKLSCTVLLGLGGKKRTKKHALNTAKALSAIDPNYIGALSLITVPEVPLYEKIQKKEFEVISPLDVLKELRILIENTNITAGVFSANHASNYLPLQIRIPGGKEDALKKIDAALNGEISLIPEFLRTL